MASVFEESARRWRWKRWSPIWSRARSMSPARRSWWISSPGERLSVAGGLAARRVQDAVSWKRDGHRSAAHWLAASTGVSVAAASRSLQTARELEAYRRRRRRSVPVSSPKPKPARSRRPRPRTRAPKRACWNRRSSSRGLRTRVGKRRYAPPKTSRPRRLHEGRAAYAWTDRDGFYRLNVSLAPDEAPASTRRYKPPPTRSSTPRGAGDREPRAAYMADAVMALFAHGPAKPIEVRLDADHAAIQRGYVEPGERCEIAGIGPIPVTMARALLNDARITVLGREGSDITTISSPERTIPAKLRRWLEATYRSVAPKAATAANASRSTTSSPSKTTAPPTRSTAGASAPITTNSRPTTAGKSKDPSAREDSYHPTNPTRHERAITRSRGSSPNLRPREMAPRDARR